ARWPGCASRSSRWTWSAPCTGIWIQWSRRRATDRIDSRARASQDAPVKTVCICADARAADGYGRALRGERAALLFTDPPYCPLTRRRRAGDLRDPKGRKIEGELVLRFEYVRDYR